jgi:hypothetical protein
MTEDVGLVMDRTKVYSCEWVMDSGAWEAELTRQVCGCVLYGYTDSNGRMKYKDTGSTRTQEVQ